MPPTSAHSMIRGITASLRPATRLGRRTQSSAPRIWRRPASSSSTPKGPAPRGVVTPKLTHKPLPYAPRPAKTEPTKSAPGRTAPKAVIDVSRQIAIFGAGAAALCLGASVASLLYYNWGEAPKYITGQEPSAPTGRPAIQSPLEFDAHLDKSEWRLGITKLRRRLAATATGHVLEIAVGTGRNFEFYNFDRITEAPAAEPGKTRTKPPPEAAGGMESFTGVDISAEMLDIALRRVRQHVAGAADEVPRKPRFADLATRGAVTGLEGVNLQQGRLRLVRADAQSALPAPPRGRDRYDTVVQTFGVCSVREPAALLRAMAARVQPGTGRIVLVEHGRSGLEWLDGLLDRSAADHHERFGCWWNRDIEAVVREAVGQVPGLEVVEFERPGWALGTNMWIELRVREEPGAAGEKRDEGTEKEDGGDGGWLSKAMSGMLSVPKPKSDEDTKR